jgi:glucose-1-phosphate adenylyltransferase
MRAAGLIFADSYDVDLTNLTDKRTLAAVPFGARYRVIDFMMSSMVNADVRNVGIITSQRYHSLMRHIRGGEPWDLDRKRSGVDFLPPFSNTNNSVVYENRLEAFQANLMYLKEIPEDYIIFTSCNYVANIDFKRMLDFHISTGADITGMYTNSPINKQPELPVTEYRVEDDGRISDVRVAPGHIDGMKIAANTYIMGREKLIASVEESIRDGRKSFRRDILSEYVKHGKVMAYEAKETLLFLDDTSNYLKSSLRLLDKNIRDEIFHNEGRPIVTKVKDSAPTKYGPEAKVCNSLIADGAQIDGEVRNSIIFRGVKIKKGSLVENSVVMQDTTVGECVRLNYAVLDKNVYINDGRMLSGYITHPFYVGHRVII